MILLPSPPTWDEFFMRHVYLVATKSKDCRTKIGSVLVRDGIIISEGYNSFPRGVLDLTERYQNKFIKHRLVSHSEENSITNCARIGTCTLNSVLYTSGLPCENCCKTLIQAGVVEVVIHRQWPEMDTEKWRESAKYSNMMFSEAGIKIRVFDMVLGLEGYVDGERIKV